MYRAQALESLVDSESDYRSNMDSFGYMLHVTTSEMTLGVSLVDKSGGFSIRFNPHRST